MGSIILIGDNRPTWEAYNDSLDKRETLVIERQAILDYQDKLDHARDRLDEEGISEAELQELDAELEDMMPSAVRAQLPEGSAPAVTIKTDLTEEARAAPVPVSNFSSPGLN